MREALTNWAGNYQFHSERIHRPGTVEQVQDIVSRCATVKALGSRHSFNTIADTDADHVSLERFNQVEEVDHERRTVTIGAGVRYGDLCGMLHRAGFALHNLASLPHISVAGACATATHGSGDQNGCLATAVRALEMVTANGEIVSLSRDRDGEQFRGAVVGLGALGVVTRLTLDVVPTFVVRQDVYENLPLAAVEQHFDALFSRAYSVSLFTDWRGDAVNQVWVKSRVTGSEPRTPESSLFGATIAASSRHPLPELSAENCTEQMGICGPWHERLPHFRMEFTPSAGEELQSEYLVPRQDAVRALHAINGIRDRVAPCLLISEIRTIAADDLWMSPFYKQPCVGIHFTWRKDWPAVREVMPAIEEALEPFNARSHWGKLFTMAPSRVQSLYEKLPDFQQLIRQYDPDGKFRNAFLDAYINPVDAMGR